MPLSRLSEMQNFCPTCFAFNADILCATCSAIDRLRAILIIELSKTSDVGGNPEAPPARGRVLPFAARPLNAVEDTRNTARVQ